MNPYKCILINVYRSTCQYISNNTFLQPLQTEDLPKYHRPQCPQFKARLLPIHLLTDVTSTIAEVGGSKYDDGTYLNKSKREVLHNPFSVRFHMNHSKKHTKKSMILND